VRIDFSKKKAENKDDLKGFILHQLRNIAKKYGILLERGQYDEAFDELLTKLSEINKVVVLIDEYDKPIIDNIENKELAIELREILKGFYTIIKACDEHIRFVLLTGVSKFSKAGVFSGLNNLEDISMDARHSSKEYDKTFMTYILGYPNFEVENSFQYALLSNYSGIHVDGYLIDLVRTLRNDDFETFFDTLRIFFADIPYDLHIKKEKYYQTIFYLIFSLIGLKVEAEVKTNKGRIDAVIIDKEIYVFEFKFDGDKDQALNQIKEKKYFEKYQGKGKKIYLFGVEFIDKNVGKWVVEKI